MKEFFTILISCVIGTCMQGEPAAVNADPLQSAQTQVQIERVLKERFYGRSLAANYLSSQFAQNHHDWERAVGFIQPMLKHTPEDAQLLNKGMVLALGSGQMEMASQLAHKISALDGEYNALSELFVALELFQNKRYDEAIDYIAKSPEGSLSDFLQPLLEGWAYAGSGKLKTEKLSQNTIHIYHAILIAEYLGEHDHIKYLLSKSLGAQGVSLQDLERIADVYAHIGEKKIAEELYKKLLAQWPENRLLAQKVSAFKSGEKTSFIEKVNSPEEGLAKALYDMARLLSQEQSDESARVFAHMALFIDPAMSNASLLLGYIAARNQNYKDAISYYRSVKEDAPQYAESIRMAADLMENSGLVDDALVELEILVRTHSDLEALIQIGDIYRRTEEFGKAVATYNQASDIVGKPVPKEYWQLLYVRGISYERLGNWKKAEKDLIAALEYQPNHPLILNYLGYAWADQGVNLKQSLNYIRKAAMIQPSDGYITDSLGWALYRMGEYKEAIPHLEKAVELLPYDSIVNDHLGDVYWENGRKLEARFQWTRAKNYSKEEKFIADIEHKLENGLQNLDTVKEASSNPDKINLFKP